MTRRTRMSRNPDTMHVLLAFSCATNHSARARAWRNGYVQLPTNACPHHNHSPIERKFVVETTRSPPAAQTHKSGES